MWHLSFFILLLISYPAFSQKKWDGGGGNNQWINALNWTGNALPTATDDIVLDNSLVAVNYNVILPATAVTVKTIIITPAASRAIELTLPAANTLLPGLTVSGPGYGLIINAGGTFRNSSGSTSGNAVRVLDSIRINNDGRYVHNSSSGHASNVQVLSMITGTEKGIMELDIPSASSTISISSRTFGKLVLRAVAAGGTCNYTAAGTSRVNIRNTLDVGVGVNLNLNCTDTIFVGADLLQETGTINLGNSTRSVVLAVFQTITQNTGGIITETGTGTQTILMNGTGLQVVTFKGTISNQVALVKDAIGTVLCKSPVSLPYKLGLKNGKIVTTQGLITLQPPCIIEADTLALNTFIDGPLKKDGMSNQSFLFPVGKSGAMRWLYLTNATGNFTVEYLRTDPRTLSSTNGSGIAHISTVEYWDITTAGTAAASVKLSFVHPNSGAVTDLSALRVARLINGTWEDAGNAAISGTPGSDGWVSSNAAGGFSATSKSFALASAIGQENPLPLSSIRLRARKNKSTIIFSWATDADMNCKNFQLQRSYDGVNYSTIFSSTASLSYFYTSDNVNAYFRLTGEKNNEWGKYTSNIVFVSVIEKEVQTYTVVDLYGRLIKVFNHNSHLSPRLLQEQLSNAPSGIYFIRQITGNNIIRYFKR
ncbi:MAG TPA: T9SS type A sorting domain-containing protein [Flavitalea sp.]|nr:T9SS type A sorting domain-containing protein [Flavitalea sp.]